MKKKTNQNSDTNQKKVNKKKKSGFVTFFLGMIIIVGLCALAYPTVSNWWNQKHATQAIASYREEVQKIPDDTLQKMMEEARNYNASLQPGVDFDLTKEELETYYSILDVSGTGIMGYIEIPSIDVYLPIYHGTDDKVLEVAAGHIEGSSLPVGGEGTHSVISGHRGLPTANLFTHLDQVKEGDVFIITVLEEVMTYQVDQIRIVYPEDTADLAIESGKDYVTLVTCTPYGVNTHRMLVRGHRIENAANGLSAIVVSEATRISPTLVMCGIGVPIIIITMITAFIVSGVKRRRKSKDTILKEMERDNTNQTVKENEADSEDGKDNEVETKKNEVKSEDGKDNEVETEINKDNEVETKENELENRDETEVVTTTQMDLGGEKDAE